MATGTGPRRTIPGTRLHLRTHTLRHLAAGAGLHEDDSSASKRITPKGLRQGVATGQRVLMIYDRAAVNLHYWQRCRRECAVYFLSRVKAGMVFSLEQSRAWDASDRRHRGVISDWEVTSRTGQQLRIITYFDAPSAQLDEFLTNEPDLAQGILVELYRRRWEIEKVFDDVKNKLGQVKAWASGLTAKTAQAQFIVLTHNLLVGYEYLLEQRHQPGGGPTTRPSHRVCPGGCARISAPLSSLVLLPRRATQRSVKFIRWLRQALRESHAEATAVLHLKYLYATL